MSAPNDLKFTSSNKEKVSLLTNRKQGENYHMRPVKTRHTGFSVIVTTAMCAKSLHIEGATERGTETQCSREKPIDRLRSDRVVTLLLSLLGGGRERKTYRECAR